MTVKSRDLFAVLLFCLLLNPVLSLAQSTTEGAPKPVAEDVTPKLRVLTKRIEPFVAFQSDVYSGFSIDLWRLIAADRKWNFELVLAPTLADLLKDMEQGRADAAIAAISITAEREKLIDFSHPFFRSGLQIMVSGEAGNTGVQIWGAIRDLFTSTAFAYAAAIFMFSVLLVSHITWLLERKRNPQFARAYLPGIWDAFWWAVVTITTVGYGDKAPKAFSGRVFALFWMIFGYFMFAYFTASVTSTVTVQELRGTIRGPEDLFGHKVATIAKSTSSAYFQRQGIGGNMVPVDRIEQAYDMLEKGEVDAIVHDAPVLQHHAAHGGRGHTKMTGSVFNEEEYGIALPRESPLREQINQSILNLKESGEYQKLYDKWFGQAK